MASITYNVEGTVLADDAAVIYSGKVPWHLSNKSRNKLMHAANGNGSFFNLVWLSAMICNVMILRDLMWDMYSGDNVIAENYVKVTGPSFLGSGFGEDCFADWESECFASKNLWFFASGISSLCLLTLMAGRTGKRPTVISRALRVGHRRCVIRRYRRSAQTLGRIKR